VCPTIESDGRGHFIISSTGQRFQGTTSNDGATKVFRPTQRVVLDFHVGGRDNSYSQPSYNYPVKAILESVRAAAHPKDSGGAVAGGGAVGGVYRVCDIQQIKVSVLSDGWSGVPLGTSVVLCSGGPSGSFHYHHHFANVCPTIESDGRGHFLFPPLVSVFKELQPIMAPQKFSDLRKELF
jgi:hypothetical protein